MIEKCIVEIQGAFLVKIRDYAFNGNIGENAFKHIDKFLEVVGPIKINGLTQDQFRLSVFPVSLAGAASEWFTKECIGLITTWDNMVERYKYVNANLIPSLSINLMSKNFYYSIIKDKDEGKSHARTLIDIPVFIRSFSIITGFTIIDGDDITKDVVLGMKFCKKYALCQMIVKRFALGDKCKRIIKDE
ncbi:hypothetical protein Tco_0385722 [Tanacetum coccineum]